MFRKISLKLITILAMTFSLNFNVQAKEISLEEFLGIDDQIFSLSKKKENAFDSAAATYVISSEDIRRSGVTSIPEALRMAPGLHVARQGSGKWAIASRGFNHQYSNKLLILVDGRIVYSPVFSGAFWDIEDYVLEDIDRIEVIRGPGGTIWGANAVNGIINIITKDAASTTGTYTSFTAGNLDKNITEGRYGGRIGEDLFYRVYAKHAQRSDMDFTNGQNSRDDWMHQRSGFRTDYYKSDKETITFHGDVHRGKLNNYFTDFPQSNTSAFRVDPDTKESLGSNIVAKWDKVISNKSSVAVQAYIDYRKFASETLDRSAYTYDLDFQHVYALSKNNQIIWGLNYRLITDNMQHGDVLQYFPDKRIDDIWSAFIQEKITMFDQKLDFIIGSKFEHNDYTHFEFQPNVKLAYYPADNQTLWMGVSRAVRTPTRGEDGFIHPISGANDGFTSLKGSEQYEAEGLVAYEIGYRIRPTERTMIDIAAFYNDYNNLQTFESVTGTGTSKTFLPADNNGDAESFGIELNAKFDVNRHWKLEAAYSFIKMNVDIDAGSQDFFLHDEERTLPNNQFRLTSLLNITPQLELDSTLYYVDSITETSFSTQVPIDEYYRLDLILTYKPVEDMAISLVGQNLTEDTHQEYGVSLYSNNGVDVPRSYHAKVSYKF